MEKIKHRTIHFRKYAKEKSTKTALLAGILLGAMVVSLCTMLVLILR